MRDVLDGSSQKVKILIDEHSINEPGSGGASFVFYDLVVEKAKRRKGIEAELKAEWGKDNYSYANHTFQDTEDTRNRNRLAFAPVHKANFGVNNRVLEIC